MLRLGLDIGGTKIEAVVLNEHGERVYRQRYPTPKDSYDAFFHSVIAIIEQAQSAFSTATSIGIGIPGTMDVTTALVKNSNIQILNNQPFAQELIHKLNQPVTVSNDANCFTLSEAIDGGGKGHDVVFGVILGTGCGGGLSVGQRIITGANSCAGEWGHNPLAHYTEERDGQQVTCYCGQQNCVESFISGTGLERQYLAQYGSALQVSDIVNKAKNSDANALAIWDRYLDQLARSMAFIVNIIDPDAIVLGGGVSNVDILYPDLQARVSEYVFGKQCRTHFRRAVHGDSSGVRGAAWLGANTSVKHPTS